jgi:hypothetical protein
MVTLKRENSSIIINKVPPQICENCGEYYLSEKVSEQVSNLANEEMERNTEVEILHFSA